MTRQEIIEALEYDKILDYISTWQLEYIVNFVIMNYKEDE